MDRKPSRGGHGDRPNRPFPAGARQGSGEAQRRKPIPPEKTHAEEFYYLKQMNAKTPMEIVLADGEVIRGWIEWYDEACIKVHRHEGPNLMIFKRFIKYLYKDPNAETAE